MMTCVGVYVSYNIKHWKHYRYLEAYIFMKQILLIYSCALKSDSQYVTSQD